MNGSTVTSPVRVRWSFSLATGWTSSRGTASSAVMTANLPVLQDPTPLAQDRHSFAVRSDTVDLEIRASDHEIGMRVGLVHPSGVCLVDREVVERPRDAVAPRDVRGRVLVEERVLEDDAGLADARRLVDQ